MSNKVWDEERIREEFKKLDSITGLHGANLPITFGKAKHTLGVSAKLYSVRKKDD